MGRVNILDISIANKIAAGEVVERPAAIVKELVENSIDAKAKNILIQIHGGGKELIKISDDGEGIHNDDIEKIFLPHATSKIQKEEDLYNINSLGFRGEALPSIASVSKVFLKSRSDEFNYGMSIQIDGGIIIDKCECACNVGTEIEVRDLFYNTPARFKFLKSENRETAIIRDVVTKLAISNYEISFEYMVNDKLVFKTTGKSLRDAIINIFGLNVLENLFFVENNCEKLNIFGYIGDINFCKSSRNNQYFFVNNRIVKNKNLVLSIENAYRNYMTVNKFPFFILFLSVNPKDIDVNIHPTKAEIKFEDEKMIYGFLYKTCINELNDYLSNSTLVKKNYLGDISPLENSNNFNLTQSKITPLSKEEVQDLIKKRENDLYNQTIENEIPYNLVSKEFDKNQLENLEENFKFEILKEDNFSDFKIIGQYNNTYIIGEWYKCLYIIDQHVAHEKILFEEFIQRIKTKTIVRQLILPIIVNLEQLEYATYKSNKDCFEKCGFSIEDFGENSIIIREVPFEFKDCDVKSLILEIISNIDNFGSGTLDEVKYNLIATKACKSAVKANCQLNMDEIKILLSKLMELENPFTCPHGRPIIIKFSLVEIEKMFKRV